MGDDLSEARNAILATTARGGTALYNGTYLALKEMTKLRRDNGEVRRQAIVVLSDGDDTASLLSYDDVLDLAKQTGIAIYTISLRSKTDVLRAAARRASVLLAVRLRNESAGAGDRREVVFPCRHI